MRIAATLLALIASAGLALAASDFDVKPRPVRTPAPEYPNSLRNDKIEGLVVVEIAIDENGRVTDAKVVKSNQSRLEPYAVKAVKKWVFKPATKNEVPVPSQISIPIQFSLDE